MERGGLDQAAKEITIDVSKYLAFAAPLSAEHCQTEGIEESEQGVDGLQTKCQWLVMAIRYMKKYFPVISSRANEISNAMKQLQDWSSTFGSLKPQAQYNSLGPKLKLLQTYGK